MKIVLGKGKKHNGLKVRKIVVICTNQTNASLDIINYN